MILPTARAIAFLFVLLPLAFCLTQWPEPAPRLIVGLPLLFLAIGLLEGLVLARMQSKSAAIAIAREIPVGDSTQFQISLQRGNGAPAGRLSLVWEGTGPLLPDWPETIALPPGDCEIAIRVTPTRRGAFSYERLHLLWRTPSGLFGRRQTLTIKTEGVVVQNRDRIVRLAIQALGKRAETTGQRLERYSGDGSEFQSLREYAPGLDPRAMDWAASARRHALIWRERRAERNQNILLVLDTSQRMATEREGFSQLDHAIQIGLAFAMAALRAGDRVGLMAADAELRIFAPPHSGMARYSELEFACSELQAAPLPMNYAKAAALLLERVQRRSLVLWFTDFGTGNDYQFAEDLIGRLAKKHLLIPVIFPLREASELLINNQKTASDLHRKALFARMLTRREEGLRKLQRIGASPLELEPDQTFAALYARYCRIKREERIA